MDFIQESRRDSILKPGFDVLLMLRDHSCREPNVLELPLELIPRVRVIKALAVMRRYY
jgi:hypothetical protein